MINTNYIETLDFGFVPIRKNHIDGDEQTIIELSGNGNASIRLDSITQQPFAVLLNDELEVIK